ncbi:Modification methylase RsrI [Geodia barretti]|uniref:Modification methylase RsrI n=1 Tax=Geodia barretti TaxID=519541 RepID=A0AA35SCI6_GEOBA|nr:Modification methylase RsrI [Geodia barretti]
MSCGPCPTASFQLIYTSTAFTHGKAQSRTRIRVSRDDAGDRTGFQGHRYKTHVVGSSKYDDAFDDYLAFLRPRLQEGYRVLSDQGSFFFHIDYREVHYCKVMLDEIFGRDSFINEIIWAYDYGARSKTPRQPEKTGYATQKPLAVIRRIVRVHSNPGDRLLDFFAGSGTIGEAASLEDRNYTLIDNNPEAIDVMRQRLGDSSTDLTQYAKSNGDTP